MVASRFREVLPSTMFWPMDRNMTSRASCVRPRWVREPRMVCDCIRWSARQYERRR